tara:strand:+ start:1217 stop:1606 length:390 start_codon:yes stop_codon:yes gene_type:complete
MRDSWYDTTTEENKPDEYFSPNSLRIHTIVSALDNQCKSSLEGSFNTLSTDVTVWKNSNELLHAVQPLFHFADGVEYAAVYVCDTTFDVIEEFREKFLWPLLTYGVLKSGEQKYVISLSHISAFMKAIT